MSNEFCVNRKCTFPSHKKFSPAGNMTEGIYILDIKAMGKTAFYLWYIAGNFLSDKKLARLMNCTKEISDLRILFGTMSDSKEKIYFY